MSDLYDTDVAAWAEQQARALRRRAANEIDWDNVAEEIEGVAASQKREIRRRLRVICEHILKWRHYGQRRWWAGHGWRKTLTEQRRQLQDLFEDSPSLRRFAAIALQPAFVTRGRMWSSMSAGSGCPATFVHGPWNRFCLWISCQRNRRGNAGIDTDSGERAKARGERLGRRPKLTPHQQQEARRRRDGGRETLADIVRSYNDHNSTISRLAA